jgi:hypothetical protein
MQRDMHYYGVYAIAYAAGMNHRMAEIVATSSQFVDDLAEKVNIDFTDAEKFSSIATAHHALSISNIDKDDQRNVWVPFHFLPGNEGESFTERLLCTKDSSIAHEMLEDSLLACSTSHGPYRIGISAHVYADTFSHYGFSGVSSRWNSVDNSSIELKNVSGEIKIYIMGKANKFFEKTKYVLENIKCNIAEKCSSALGHGGVATYPDRPYLTWDFNYDEKPRQHGVRNNQATYLEACQGLYDFFSKIISKDTTFSDGTRTPSQFKDIREHLLEIIMVQDNEDQRSQKWKDDASSGKITGNPFTIPEYNGLNWIENINSLRGTLYPEDFISDAGYLYSVAAHEHLDHIIHHLLPKYNLVVS